MEVAKNYAGSWERFEASLFDFGGLLVLTAITIFIVGLAAGLPPDTMALTLPTWLIVSGIYSVILWTRRGQTLGKRVIGIKIVKNDGRPISIGGAILRYVALIGPSIILSIAFFFARLELEYIPGSFNWDLLFIPLILSTPLFPLITIILNSKNQGLHDKIAGTLVIRFS